MVETSQGGDGIMNAEAETFWKQLQQATVVSGEMPDSNEIKSPWYVRVMLGVSGWIAAVFLIGFLALGMEFVIDSEVAAIVVGLLMITAAYFIFSAAGNDFAQQFGMAVSFAGQGFLLFGFAGLLDWDVGMFWLMALVQLVIAIIMPNFIQRLVAAYLAVNLFSVALGYHGFIASVLAATAIAVIWLKEFTWGRWNGLMRPIGYGLTLALVDLEGFVLFGRSMLFSVYVEKEPWIVIPPWIADAAIGLLLVAVVARLFLLNGISWSSRPMLLALFAVAILAGLSFEMPGLAVGFLVIILGFSNANRILVGIGIVALLFYLSTYYYMLQTTLLVKSEILAVTGALLLSARWLVLKWVFPVKEPSHA
jgi:hypothetical protein